MALPVAGEAVKREDHGLSAPKGDARKPKQSRVEPQLERSELQRRHVTSASCAARISEGRRSIAALQAATQSRFPPSFLALCIIATASLSMTSG